MSMTEHNVRPFRNGAAGQKKKKGAAEPGLRKLSEIAPADRRALKERIIKLKAGMSKAAAFRQVGVTSHAGDFLLYHENMKQPPSRKAKVRAKAANAEALDSRIKAAQATYREGYSLAEAARRHCILESLLEQALRQQPAPSRHFEFR
jgi:hypothetical protein